MKKLLFATALVATAAAFADGPISAISFEGYTTLPYTFVNGTAEKDETGTDKTPNGPYFFYDGEQDGSSVKAFGGENAAAPAITRPLAFANASPNANYLDLSTEGGILWRSINTITQGGTQEDPTYDLGNEKAIDADSGLYLDTLVQFTPTEDGGTPDIDENTDKLAIWLNVDSSGASPVTNLMVRAAIIDDGFNLTPTNFVITNASVVAGSWYRLTVKAIADATQADEVPAFQIYLDGTLLASSQLSFSDDYVDLIDSDYKSAIEAGAVFVSLLGVSSNPSLTAVGFKGSGALDDIVWTEEDPFAGGASSDYVVEIGGSDVVITPQAGDLAALQAAIVAGGGTLDVTDVDAVNAALANPIPGTSPAIPSWQALFLGVAPTTNGLEQVAIESITIANGTVTVAMSDDLTLMTGRGVDIVLKVLGSNDLTTWDTTNPLATATNTLTIPAITPAQGETKKFYKVVVEFAASSAQD